MVRVLFGALVIAVVVFHFSAGLALLVGIVFATVFKNPFFDHIKKHNHRLLSWSIIGLGATVNLYTVLKVGAEGIGYTALSIGAAFALGYIFSRIFKIEKDLSLLITSGTAICGGSAIAAVSSTLKSKSEDTGVALAVVFILNAVALWVFPTLGTELGLSPKAFGMWCALAIHDTSSVVGASMLWGEESLQVATTVKLARALWIIPLSLTLGFIYSKKKSGPIKFPWFILGFLLVSYVVTAFPLFKEVGAVLGMAAKKGFVLALFFIGTTINFAQIKKVGPKPFYFGVTLWFLICVGSYAIINFTN